MRCPKCGSYNCYIINERTEKGRDYHGCKGVIGYLIWGPVGLLCGLCGKGRETKEINYWICEDCGRKWKA